MIKLEYANAYSEVLEILKYISIEDYNKIPKSKIELFKIYANYDYKFEYNPQKTLDEQNVSKISKGIIAILFRDYWADSIQRKRIISKQNYDRRQKEEQKTQKYRQDNLFENQNLNTKSIKNEPNPIENVVIEYKETFFIKIKNWFKNLFFKK